MYWGSYPSYNPYPTSHGHHFPPPALSNQAGIYQNSHLTPPGSQSQQPQGLQLQLPPNSHLHPPPNPNAYYYNPPQPPHVYSYGFPLGTNYGPMGPSATFQTLYPQMPPVKREVTNTSMKFSADKTPSNS